MERRIHGPVKILIVEDDETTARAIDAYLRHDGFSVAIARDGGAALDAVARERPHLIILDIMLPVLDGMDVCRALRQRDDVPIIMLTARTTEDDKLEALSAGADDYVAKPFSPRELVARVKSVLRRSYSGERRVAALAFDEMVIDRGARTVRVRGNALALTPTEFRIIEVLAVSAETVLSRSDLVERALGFDYEGMERTVDVHVRNVRKKIEAAGGSPQRIRTVFGTGYAFVKNLDA
jgi:DNA-binding response OmpR family regulator